MHLSGCVANIQCENTLIQDLPPLNFIVFFETTKGFDPLKGLAVIAYFER